CLRKELLGADDATVGGDEDFEHSELFSRERDVATVTVDLSAERIEPQTSDLPHGRPDVGTPAVKRPEAEHEVAKLEWLREIVISAELEPRCLVVETVGGGEHEDRHATVGLDDVFGDLVTSRPGDVSVEHGDVVGVDAQQLQSGVAVTGDICGDRFLAKPIAD